MSLSASVDRAVRQRCPPLAHQGIAALTMTQGNGQSTAPPGSPIRSVYGLQQAFILEAALGQVVVGARLPGPAGGPPPGPLYETIVTGIDRN